MGLKESPALNNGTHSKLSSWDQVPEERGRAGVRTEKIQSAVYLIHACESVFECGYFISLSLPLKGS